MSEFKIVKTVELTSMPNPQLARDLLERLRAATAKVMTSRKWKVGVLKEFYPKNKGLLGLNVNRGQSIMIRLREGDDQFSFLPWHSVLGTLVHELTHNEIGEHSAEFYKAVDKLYDEVEATGSDAGILWGARNAPAPKYDFDGKSAKVGGGQLAKAAGIPGSSVRQLAAEAALRRASQASSGPQVLGGARPAATKTHKELFMEGELKRRQQYEDGQGCSVVKSPVAAAKGKFTQFSDESPTEPAGGIPSTDATAWQWTCHVCTELNTSLLPAVRPSATGSSSSSNRRGSVTTKAEGEAGVGAAAADVVCAWCGCTYGSTLEQPTLAAAANTGGDLEVICIDCSPEIGSAWAVAGPSNKRRKLSTAEDESTAAINLTADEQDAQNVYDRQKYCPRSLLPQRDCGCCAPQRPGRAVKREAPGASSSQAGRSVNTAGDEKVDKTKGPTEIIDLID